MNKKAFTLIEILVIITIIGIISAVIFVISNSAISSTQNARIKHDIDSLRKVILSYKAYYRLAPVEDPACIIGIDCSQLASDLLAIDPNISFPTNPSGGYYRYYSANGTTFTITADLPNSRTLVYDFQNGYSEYATLAGYSKRKSITVSNSGSTLTNYQMKFTIYRSAGTDSGFNVYVGTNCQSDYDDIRFTNSSNTVLDYWIESSDASSATIWVEADSIAASGNTTLYLYYGNAVASTVSNGTNTFPVFDDFSNLDNWNVLRGTWGVTTINGKKYAYHYNGDSQEIRHKTYAPNYTDDLILEATIRFSGDGNYGGGIQFPFQYSSTEGPLLKLFAGANQCSVYWTSEFKKYPNIVANTDYNVQIIYTKTNIKTYINGGAQHNQAITQPTGQSTSYSTLGLWGGLNSYYTYFAYLKSRKYTATEPTVSAWGTEESL